MNVTGYSSESAQSAIAANFTAFLSQTRSLLFLRTPPASAIRRSSPSRLSVPHGAELRKGLLVGGPGLISVLALLAPDLGFLGRLGLPCRTGAIPASTSEQSF